MEISLPELTVFSGCDEAFSLYSYTTWPPSELTGHVLVLFGIGYCGDFSAYLKVEKCRSTMYCKTIDCSVSYFVFFASEDKSHD